MQMLAMFLALYLALGLGVFMTFIAMGTVVEEIRLGSVFEFFLMATICLLAGPLVIRLLVKDESWSPEKRASR